jgi:hypothetical protein
LFVLGTACHVGSIRSPEHGTYCLYAHFSHSTPSLLSSKASVTPSDTVAYVTRHFCTSHYCLSPARFAAASTRENSSSDERISVSLSVGLSMKEISLAESFVVTWKPFAAAFSLRFCTQSQVSPHIYLSQFSRNYSKPVYLFYSNILMQDVTKNTPEARGKNKAQQLRSAKPRNKLQQRCALFELLIIILTPPANSPAFAAACCCSPSPIRAGEIKAHAFFWRITGFMFSIS